jgi:hypothetical protein
MTEREVRMGPIKESNSSDADQEPSKNQNKATLTMEEDQEKVKRTCTESKEEDEETDTTDKEEEDFDKENCEGSPTKKAKYPNAVGCLSCGVYPCLWVQYSEALRFDAEFYSASNGYDGDITTNNLVRKHLYKRFVAMHHGIGNPRIPIPGCVLKKVRFYFPDPLHKYMGFKADYDEDHKQALKKECG